MFSKDKNLHYFCYKYIKAQTLEFESSPFVCNIIVITFGSSVRKICSTVGPLYEELGGEKE